jgi:hypothetical protein
MPEQWLASGEKRKKENKKINKNWCGGRVYTKFDETS